MQIVAIFASKKVSVLINGRDSIGRRLVLNADGQFATTGFYLSSEN